MAQGHKRSLEFAGNWIAELGVEGARERLQPDFSPAADAPLTSPTSSSAASVERRWRRLSASPESQAQLTESLIQADPQVYERNIENLSGLATLPIGVAGPLRVNGLSAGGDYFVPLATTEAALVSSYERGCRTITEAGGAASVVLSEGVCRAPAFLFDRLAQALEFVVWVMGRVEDLRVVAQSTTRHGSLVEVRSHLEGGHVYLILEYTTGDASGQNMVTLATEAVCQFIVAHCPQAPRTWFVEANMSGDKKASMLSFLGVRGKKVSADVVVPGEVVARRLKTTPSAMETYWRTSALGGVMSGSIGVQGHFANGLAALYIATGQDAACVAESSVGVTRMEARGEDLYAAVTLPNIMVGTVGGGTGLPTQSACLDILGLRGAGKARALAEVVGALALAGELSIIAALSAGHFAQAHRKLARGGAPERASSINGE